MLPTTANNVERALQTSDSYWNQLLADESNTGKWKLVRLDLAAYMRLDAAAVDALRLLPNKKDGSCDEAMAIDRTPPIHDSLSLVATVNKTMNLYWLLNKCTTPMGSRLLMQWIRQPLMDVERINERLDFVEVFARNDFMRAILRVPLDRSINPSTRARCRHGLILPVRRRTIS